MQTPVYAGKGAAGPELIQVKTLNKKSMNSYTVEIRRKDESRARAALRLPES